MAISRLVARKWKGLPRVRSIPIERVFFCLLLLTFIGSLSGCLGVTGGTDVLSAKFKGVDAAVVTSPNSATVTWTPVSGYSKYEVYISTQDEPIGSTVFNNFTIKNLNPNISYSFSVAGVKSSGTKDGIQKQVTLQTWSQFQGATSATAIDSQSVQLRWNYQSGPTFQVFYAAGAAPASVAGTPQLTTQSSTGVVVSGLQPSTQYFFIVTAKYPDGSTSTQSLVAPTTLNAQYYTSNLANAPTITTLQNVTSTDLPSFTVLGSPFSYISTFYTGSVANPLSCPTIPNGQVIAVQNGSGTATASAPFSVGTHNITIQILDSITLNCTYASFSGIVSASAAPSSSNTVVHATTPTGLTSLPSVSASSRQLGPFPAFQVSGGLATYTTTLYYMGPSTPPALNTVIGSITGISTGNTGTIQTASNTPLPRGRVVVQPVVSLGSQSVSLSPLTIMIKDVDPDAITPNPYLGATQAAANSVQAGATGGGAGTASAVGDFNCDGYSDLAIGAPYASFRATGISRVNRDQTDFQNGAVMVYYGSASGLLGLNPSIQPVLNPTSALNPRLIPAPASGAAGGNGNGQHFGQTLASGNINGDTSGANACSDLVVGAPQENSVVGAYTFGVHGAIYVYYGSNPNGLQVDTATDSYVLNDVTCSNAASSTCSTGKYSYNLAASVDTQSNPTTGSGASHFRSFGGAVAVGDLNGDGKDDVAVGDTFAEENVTPPAAGGLSASLAVSGAVFVYYGSGNGLTGRYIQIRPPVKCPNAAGGACNQVDGTLGNPYAFGSSLAIGNVSDALGNGLKDLVIGWPKYRTSSDTNVVGAVVIVEGTTALPSTYLGTVVGGVWTGNSQGGHLLPNPTGAAPNTGAYYVLAPSSGLLSDSRFGYSVALANVNNDTYQDILIGAPNADPPGGNGAREGAVFVYYGGAGGVVGPGVTPAQNVKTCPEGTCNPQVMYRTDGYRSSFFGGAIANVGDVNGDGIDDVGIGAASANPLQNNKTTNNGLAYIYYGSSTGLSPSPTTIFNINSPDNAFFGATLVGGNFRNITYSSGTCSGKKCNDIAIGAPGDAPGGLLGNGYGLAHIFANSGSGFIPLVSSDSGATPLVPGYNSGQRFHLARIVGDINGDGYADVASPLNGSAGLRPLTAYTPNTVDFMVDAAPANSNAVVVYYGSSSGLVMGDTCLDSSGNSVPSCTAGTGPSLVPLTPNAPQLIYDRGFGDPTFSEVNFGNNVLPIGSANGDQYADLLVTDSSIGSPNLYVLYGSANGLVASVAPKVSPVNQYDPKIVSSGSLGGRVGMGVNSSALVSQSLGAHGDFNGDQIGDFAVYMDVTGGNPADPVVVIYGSVNGVLTNGVVLTPADAGYPDADPLKNAYQIPNCTGTFGVDQICSPVEICFVIGGANPGRCEVAAESPPPNLTNGNPFAYPVVPVGPTALTSPGDMDKDGTDDLVVAVRGDNGNQGNVFLYYGSTLGIDQRNAVKLVVQGSGSGGNRLLGSDLSGAGDVNGDGIADLVLGGGGFRITGGGSGENLPGLSGAGTAYLIYGINGGYRSNASICAGYPCTVNITNVPAPDYLPNHIVEKIDNSCDSTTNRCNPMRFYPTGIGAGWNFGEGVLGIGDITGDGFGDVAVTAARLGTVPGVVIFSGSQTGLKVNGGLNQQPTCTAGVCSPFQVKFNYNKPNMPQGNTGSPLFSAASQHWLMRGWGGAGDIDGDGTKDFLIPSQYINDPNGKGFYNGGFFLFH